jgi:hypothetical protein
MQAAYHIHLVLRQGVLEMTASHSYRQWLAALFEHKIQNLKKMYEALPYDWQPALGVYKRQVLPAF